MECAANPLKNDSTPGMDIIEECFYSSPEREYRLCKDSSSGKCLELTSGASCKESCMNVIWVISYFLVLFFWFFGFYFSGVE